MKTDRITKLYDALTNKERAALAFRYLTDTNEAELDRIATSVPRLTYRCLDSEFQAWFDGFFHLACMWAIAHWKLRYQAMEAINALHVAVNFKEFPDARRALELHGQLESRLVALDRALEAICEQHGVDVEAARKLAGTETYAPMVGDIAPDAKYQKEMQAAGAAVLSPAHRSVYRAP